MVAEEVLEMEEEVEAEDHMPEPYVDEPDTAYFVIGAESSGTKMVTKLLMQAGVYGTDEHDQFIDQAIGNKERMDRYVSGEPLVVVRRSWPHGGEEPDVKGIYDALTEEGYTVMFVVTTRSYPTMIESQIEFEQHAPTRARALENISDAYLGIFYWIRRLKAPYIMVSYGDMARNKTATLHWMLNALNLGYKPGMEDVIDHERENIRVADYRSQVMRG